MLTDTQILILSIAAGLILIASLTWIILRQKNKPKVTDHVPDASIVKLYEALGQSANIIDVAIVHQRLKVTVADLKQVSQDTLKALGIAAVLKGKSLTLLIKSDIKSYHDYLTSHKKED